MDRFSYRVPRVAIILLWKYPVEVKENRERGRKKKDERRERKRKERKVDLLNEATIVRYNNSVTT